MAKHISNLSLKKEVRVLSTCSHRGVELDQVCTGMGVKWRVTNTDPMSPYVRGFWTYPALIKEVDKNIEHNKGL